MNARGVGTHVPSWRETCSRNTLLGVQCGGRSESYWRKFIVAGGLEGCYCLNGRNSRAGSQKATKHDTNRTVWVSYQAGTLVTTILPILIQRGLCDIVISPYRIRQDMHGRAGNGTNRPSLLSARKCI